MQWAENYINGYGRWWYLSFSSNPLVERREAEYAQLPDEIVRKMKAVSSENPKEYQLKIIKRQRNTISFINVYSLYANGTCQFVWLHIITDTDHACTVPRRQANIVAG